MVNGGALCNYPDMVGIPNYIYNEGDYCVIEADESDGSIQKYHPHIGIITNISHDHTSMEKLFEYFTNFASHSQNLVLNLDFPNHAKITHANLTTFSLINSQADFYADNITLNPASIEYTLQGARYNLPLIGRFNVANALAAIAACSIIGISPHDAAHALENFRGVKARLEKIGAVDDINIFHDFAHNPSKIEASLLALKSSAGRVIAMYQPHTPFSARNTGDETAAVIARVLSDDDIIIMQEIYELTPDDTDISSEHIINKIKANGHENAYFLPHKDDTLAFVLAKARSGDKIVIMGAHDNSLADFARQIVYELRNR